MRRFILSLAFAVPVLAACGGSSGSGPMTATPPASIATATVVGGPVTPQQLRVHVLRTLPHDPKAFTQGLVIDAGAFYESTGIQGHSTLRHVEIDSGRVLRQVELDPSLFGEGLARVRNQLVQLTWMNHKALVYDVFSFRSVAELTYDGEGWGLCFDDEHLVMSNGSDRLTFRDPDTFSVAREIVVKRAGQPMPRLNELECVGETVYANIWTTDTIVAIEARSGQVTAEIDAAGLLTPQEERGTDVLNGIAYDKRSGHFFITGKYWPKMFEVEFVGREGTGSAPR